LDWVEGGININTKLVIDFGIFVLALFLTPMFVGMLKEILISQPTEEAL